MRPLAATTRPTKKMFLVFINNLVSLHRSLLVQAVILIAHAPGLSPDNTVAGLRATGRSHLHFVYVTGIHGKIETVPSWFHAAMSEEETLDLVGLGALQALSAGNFVPFQESSIEHAMSDNVSYGFVAGMDTRAGSREHHARPMSSQQAGVLRFEKTIPHDGL